MAEKENGGEKRHTVAAEERARAEIGGVSEVRSFDEQAVILVTSCGELTVEGDALHVSTLDMARGVVVIDGRIDGMYYNTGAPTKKGLRARLFG